MSVINVHKRNGDFWETPEEVKNALLSMVPDTVKTVLDPCVGSGALLDTERFNYKMYDLYLQKDAPKETVQKDFLTLKPDFAVDAVIMNPPFSLTTEFIEHARAFSNDIYIIGQWKEPILNQYFSFIKDARFDYTWASKFGIKTVIGCVHLHFDNKFTFGNIKTKESVKKQLGIMTDIARSVDDLPVFTGKESNCLVFRPNLITTEHGFDVIDPNTRFEYWVTPVFTNTPNETRDYLTYHGTSGRGYKKGDLKNLHYQSFETKYQLLMAYHYYVSKDFKNSIYPNLSMFPAKEIPVIEVTDDAPKTYAQIREFTSIKEAIGNHSFHKIHNGKMITDRDLQIKGVDWVRDDGKYIDDKYVLGFYDGKMSIEVSNPQFAHSEGTFEGDKLTDYIYWYNILEGNIKVIDYKKTKAFLETERGKILTSITRPTSGYGANGTRVADVNWATLEAEGLVEKTIEIKYGTLN